MPNCTEWPEWLLTHSENDPVSRRIRAIESMKAAGAEVLVVSADVADRASMEHAAERIRQRFGTVNGVIHAAGTAGSNLIQLRTPEKALPVLVPKVRGTQVLYDLFASDGTLDFFVMCSSLAAFLGGFGMGDYATANSYMDAFANAHFTGRTLVTSIAWDVWEEVGMAVETERRTDVRAVVERKLQTAMTPAEGVQVLECILGGDSPRIAVSTIPLRERMERALHPPSAEEELEAVKSGKSARHPRPDLSVPYAAPRTPTENSIADIFSDLLGIENIGIHDSFFECGGHSLLAVQFVSQLRTQLHVEVGIATLFEAPTIAELSAVVLKLSGPADLATTLDAHSGDHELEHRYL
jgi:acyl carrier protein